MPPLPPGDYRRSAALADIQAEIAGVHRGRTVTGFVVDVPLSAQPGRGALPLSVPLSVCCSPSSSASRASSTRS